MWLHKYKSGDNTFYMISDKSTRPGGSINLSTQEHQGRASGANVNNAITAINKAFKEEAVKEEKPAPEKPRKKAALIPLAEKIRYIATKFSEEKE